MHKEKFVYPSEEIIQKTRGRTTSYTHPLYRIVFWKRFTKVYDYLCSLDREYDTILELGVAYGLCLPGFARICRKMIGTDVQLSIDRFYDVTLKQFEETIPNVEVKLADVTELTSYFEPKSIDVILAFSVMEHVPDFDKGMEEISKVLKDDGLFICELPSENWMYKQTTKFMRGYGEGHPGYTYSIWKESLDKHFNLEKMIRIPFGIPYFYTGVYKTKS